MIQLPKEADWIVFLIGTLAVTAAFLFFKEFIQAMAKAYFAKKEAQKALEYRRKSDAEMKDYSDALQAIAKSIQEINHYVVETNKSLSHYTLDRQVIFSSIARLQVTLENLLRTVADLKKYNFQMADFVERLQYTWAPKPKAKAPE